MNLQESIRRILKEETNSKNIHIRRRVETLHKLLDVALKNSYPCDFENLDGYVVGLLSDLRTYLILYKFDGMNDIEILEFIGNHLKNEIEMYYYNSIEDC
jgi:hypothetical protein